jgi:hypothetical protein
LIVPVSAWKYPTRFFVVTAFLERREAEFPVGLHSFSHCVDAERVGSQLIKGHWNSSSCSKELALDERRPEALRVPNLFHLGTRLGLVHSKHIATIAVEKGRDPIVRNAVNVHWDILELLHYGAELAKILVGRVLKVDRDVNVSHPETADAGGLVRQGLLVGVKAEVDDVADAQGANILTVTSAVAAFRSVACEG